MFVAMLRHVYFFLLYFSVCYSSPVTNIERSRQLTSVDEAELWEGNSSWQANTAKGLGVPDSANRLLTSVQSTVFHFGAPNIKQILKRSFVANVTSDGLKLRVIRTPWPMVVGQTIFSLLMAWFGLRPTRDPSLENPPLYKQIIWVVNILRAIAAAVYMAVDLATGVRDVPSVGEALIFGTVIGSSHQIDKGNMVRLASYVGILVSIAGLFLYIAMGILAWLSNGLLTPCPSAGTSSNCANLTFTTYQDVVPCPPIMWQQTAGDWEYLGSWLAGACWYALFAILPMLPNLRTCQLLHFIGNDPTGWAWQMARVNFYGMVLGGGSACLSAALSAYSPSPSSVSGFWDLWAQNKERVVKSLFTW